MWRFYWAGVLLTLCAVASLVANVAAAQAPQIVDVQATNVTDTSAIITWTTCTPGNSTVNYGNTTSLGSSVSESANVTAHSIALGNLTPATLYYYEVISAVPGNTTIDNRCGSYYTFTTYQAPVELAGWAWCTDGGAVYQALFHGYRTMVERTGASGSYSLHVAGNLTLVDLGEVVPLDMYGSRVRSLFYLRQEVTGKSATFEGTWINAANSTYYVATTGVVALPNPTGGNLKTARLCFTTLRTPDVAVALTQPGSFVDDLESMVTRFAKFTDSVLDSLVGTGIRATLGGILTKLATVMAGLRGLGTPYVP